MRDLVLSWDAATATYTFASDAFYPADGIKVASLDARGHSLYYTAAMQVRAGICSDQCCSPNCSSERYLYGFSVTLHFIL